MNKRRNPDRPICFCGKLIFEFFNNDDEDFKLRTLKSLAKEARKEFNVSCLPVELSEVANPERGALVLSLCAANRAIGQEMVQKVVAFFDGKAPARILVEEFAEGEIL